MKVRAGICFRRRTNAG